MQKLTLKETIKVGGKKFYHYSLGGKYFSKEWVVLDGITYYDSVRGEDAFINAQIYLGMAKEDKEIVLLHIVKKLEEELEECCEITCNRELCFEYIDELKRILDEEY